MSRPARLFARVLFVILLPIGPAWAAAPAAAAAAAGADAAAPPRASEKRPGTPGQMGSVKGHERWSAAIRAADRRAAAVRRHHGREGGK